MARGLELNWFGDAFRKIHVLHVSPEWASRRGECFDAHAWVQLFQSARVETVELYAKDHHGVCYYRSTRGLLYPRDVLGELVEQTRAAGLKLMAYFSVGYDAYAFGVHPDWLTVSAEGKPFQYGPFLHGCLNTPYREYALAQIEEIVRQYPVDGLWLDILSFTYRTPEHTARHLLAPCYCIHCRRKYRERFDRPMPLDPSLLERREAYRWEVETVRSFLDDADRIARSYRPNQVITYNGAGSPADPMRGADLTSIEAHAPEYSRQSFIARWSRSQGKPFEVLTPGALPGARNGWDGWDVKPANALTVEAAVVLAQGGSQVFGVAPYPDGSIDAGQMGEIGRVFERLEPVEKYVRGATSVAQVAVLLGTKPLDAPHLWSRAVAGAQDWHHALALSHHLFDVVPSVTAAVEYQVVVLPDGVPLTEDEIRELADYVSRGGRLLVSGESGLLDENGLGRPDFGPLGEALGIRFRALSEHTFGYLRITDPPTAAHIPAVPLLVKRRPVEVELAGASMLAALHLPETAMSDPTTVLWGFPPPLPEALPGITTHDHGVGRAVFSALPLGTRGFENVWGRQLAANLVDSLLGGRWLTTTAPPGVELVLTRQAKQERHVLHVVDHRAADPENGRPGGGQTPPGIRVELDSEALPVTSATSVPMGEPIPVGRSGDRVALTLPSFDTLLVVELR